MEFINNKKLGTKFENDFAKELASYGYWVHLLKQNNSGQPADVIAFRNNKGHLIDCKVCTNDRFVLSRVEENQMLAMNSFVAKGNGNGWFALLINDEIRMLSIFEVMNLIDENVKSINLKDIGMLTTTLEAWTVYN